MFTTNDVGNLAIWTIGMLLFLGFFGYAAGPMILSLLLVVAVSVALAK